jgi:hypothetical protein
LPLPRLLPVRQGRPQAAAYCRLDPALHFEEIVGNKRDPTMNDSSTPASRRRIIWPNVLTVISAAILISAEVFGAAFAGGWAVANLFDFGPYGVHAVQGIFFAFGIAVMISFVRNAQRVEPFRQR